jgi:hypothetical protein
MVGGIDPDYIITACTIFGMIGVMMCCIGTQWADPDLKFNHDIKTRQGCVHMKSLTMAFVESFRMFFGEAVIQPWRPLGLGMFVPWISGNWKGALQQWLVINLYLSTLRLLAGALEWIGIVVLLCFPFLVYGTWHFWFAITQRKPIGFPALPVGFLFSIPIATLMIGVLYSSPWIFGFTGMVVTTFAGPLIGYLMTAPYVYERRWLVRVFGLCVVLLSGPVSLLFNSLVYHPNEFEEESMLIVALTTPIQIYIGICMMVIAGKENREQEEDAQAEPVGKRNVSKQSVSTAPTDAESPTADIAHVRDEP